MVCVSLMLQELDVYSAATLNIVNGHFLAASSRTVLHVHCWIANRACSKQGANGWTCGYIMVILCQIILYIILFILPTVQYIDPYCILQLATWYFTIPTYTMRVFCGFKILWMILPFSQHHPLCRGSQRHPLCNGRCNRGQKRCFESETQSDLHLEPQGQPFKQLLFQLGWIEIFTTSNE